MVIERMVHMKLKVGDICLYSFGDKNASRCKVEVVRVLDDSRGVAEVKILEVYVDDSGNGIFNYLARTGKTMNASICYLQKLA